MAQSVIKLFHLPISVIEILLFLLPQLPFSIIALFKEILMRQFPASLHHHRMDDAFPVIKSWGNIDRFIYFIRADETPLLQQRSLSLEFNLWWHPLLSITLPIGKISVTLIGTRLQQTVLSIVHYNGLMALGFVEGSGSQLIIFTRC